MNNTTQPPRQVHPQASGVAPAREEFFTKLREVFDRYKALPRASTYYCVSRCKDGSLVMVFKQEELAQEGEALVHRSKVSEWGGLGTHPTSRCWVDELNAGVKVARLGVRHKAGKFSALPDMIGQVTCWDGEHFEVIFRPEPQTA